MNDIVEWLRDYDERDKNNQEYPPDGLIAEAADEITRLREANKELATALSVLVKLNENHGPFGGEIYQDMVNRAWDNAGIALSKHKGEQTPVKYGCHCIPGQAPGECVMGSGVTDNCVFSMELSREGKDKTHCRHWKPIKGEQK